MSRSKLKGAFSTGIVDNSDAVAINITSSEKVQLNDFTQEAGLVLRRDATGPTAGAGLVLGTNLNNEGVVLYGIADGSMLIARTTDITSDNPSGSGFGELLRLNQNGAALGGNFTVASGANSAYSLQVASTYGALVSGDDGGRGLFGTNVTTDVNNTPVIANTHGSYGGIGLSTSWGVAAIVRKGGSVTAGDTLDTVVRFDNDGLKFGSDTAAANALDDYEEGSWTPVLRTSNLDGSYTTGTIQKAWYRKIGNAVFYSFYLTGMTQNTQGTGTMQIGGLPYNSTGSLYSGGLSTYGGSIANGRGARQIVQSNSSFLRLIDESTGVDLAASAWTNISNMIIAGMYFTG